VCGSLETRNTIVQIIANDNNNPLVNYAVKNSNAVSAMVGDTNVEAEKLKILENAKRGAVYALDDTIVAKSKDRATHSVTCIGFLDGLSPHPCGIGSAAPGASAGWLLESGTRFSLCSASDGQRRRRMAMASRAWSSASKKRRATIPRAGAGIAATFQRSFIGSTKIWPG
jgi:hypothetical protein